MLAKEGARIGGIASGRAEGWMEGISLSLRQIKLRCAGSSRSYRA